MMLKIKKEKLRKKKKLYIGPGKKHGGKKCENQNFLP